MSLILRPYKLSDASVITSWLKSEYLMRQWCAYRYEHYPVTPEEMNAYHTIYRTMNVIDWNLSHNDIPYH